MKCISCGASFEDDDLYFCTECGAMMKNPVNKEVVSDNSCDTDAEAALSDSAEVTVPEATATETAETEASGAVEIPPEAEKTDDETAAGEEPVPPVEEQASSETENTPPVTENPPPPPPVENEELYIAREREKEKASQPAPPPQTDSSDNDNSGEQTESAEKAPSKPKKVGAGRIIGASVISIFAAVVLVVVSLLFSLKLGLSPDRMSKSVKDMNVRNVVNAEIGGMTVSDAVYYETDFDKATHSFADKSEFALYLSKTDVTGFLSEKVKIYADYILNGKGDEPTVTENEITEYFMEYGETGKDVFGYEMQTADYNSIRSSLSNRKTSERFSVSGIGWAIKFRLENVKHILSYPTLTILAALFLVLLIWIAVIVNHKGRYTLGLYGNILSWGGIVTIAAGFIASPIMALMYVLDEKFHYLCISLLLFPSAVYAVIIGAILTAAGAILLKTKRALKVKERINKAK